MQRYVSCLLQVLIGLDLCMGSKMQAKNESVCSSADINTKSVSEKKGRKISKLQNIAYSWPLIYSSHICDIDEIFCNWIQVNV